MINLYNLIDLKLNQANMSFVLRRSAFCSLRRLSSKVPKNGSLPEKRDGEGSKKNNVPKAGAAPMPELKRPEGEVSLETPYHPKDHYQRVSFEYPTEPTKGSNTSQLKMKKYLPYMFAIFGGAWALYTAYYFTKEDKPKDFLNPDEFIPFFISNKVDIDEDHYLIELTPKYTEWMKDQQKIDNIWNGSRMWSVEIKQPQIMVVRSYTPLPLTIINQGPGKEPLINIQTDQISDLGKLVFYIKKYDQGEVARWIYKKPLGSELELRGPFIDYEFKTTPNSNFERPQMANLPSSVKIDDNYPVKPDNLAFFAAGTGIAPILQVLLSKNPYKGFIDIYYSRKKESEQPIPRFLYFLEKLDRIKLHNFVNEKGDKLNLKHIPIPIKSHYQALLEKKEEERNERLKTVKNSLEKSPISSIKSSELSEASIKPNKPKYKTAIEKAYAERNIKKENPSLALVCGPDGYISYVAGSKPIEGQGPAGGLLKQRGWDESNIFKL